MLIRDAIDDDLPGILEIHNDAVLNTTAIWSIHTVDLENRCAFVAERLAKGFPFLVATERGAVLGYASFGDFRPHDGYFKSVEHSVYVGRSHRRRGIAAGLMRPLIERAVAMGKHAMIGGIDAANDASVRLHEAFGFERVGLLPEVGYKFDRYLDLLFMQKVLS